VHKVTLATNEGSDTLDSTDGAGIWHVWCNGKCTALKEIDRIRRALDLQQVNLLVEPAILNVIVGISGHSDKASVSVRDITRQSVGHIPAVRMPNDIHASCINGVAAEELIGESREIIHIINLWPEQRFKTTTLGTIPKPLP
jgi:hypothetical protein